MPDQAEDAVVAILRKHQESIKTSAQYMVRSIKRSISEKPEPEP